MRKLCTRLAVLLLAALPVGARAGGAAPEDELDPYLLSDHPVVVGQFSFSQFRTALGRPGWELLCDKAGLRKKERFVLERVRDVGLCYEYDPCADEGGQLGVLTFEEDMRVKDLGDWLRGSPTRHRDLTVYCEGDQAACLVSPRRLVAGNLTEVRAYLDRRAARTPNEPPEDWRAVLRAVDQTKMLWGAAVLPAKPGPGLQRVLGFKPREDLCGAILEIDTRRLDARFYLPDNDAGARFHEEATEGLRQVRQLIGLMEVREGRQYPTEYRLIRGFLDSVRLRHERGTVSVTADVPRVNDVLWQALTDKVRGPAR